MGEPNVFQASQEVAEQRVENFRMALGPFVVAAETTRMAMLFSDADGERNPIVFANDSFLRLTGFTRDDILGCDLSFLLGDVADTGTRSAMMTALASGESGTWELQCRRADGDEFLAAVYLSPVPDENGRIRQNFLSIHELGGHIERMLKQRDELHALYDLAPGFIAVSEGADHVFTFANASYKRLVGSGDLIGLTVAQALPDVAGQELVAQLDQVFETGVPLLGTGMPLHVRVPGNTTTALRYINFVYQPVRNARNNITGLFCEGYDVTAERQAANDVASMEAEIIHLSRVNAMGAMAATLAHELNQPLAAISNYVSGCMRLVDPASANAELLQSALDMAGRASQRAGDIISRLRELTRQVVPTKTYFDVKEAITECIQVVRAGHGGEVEFADLTAGKIMLTGDRTQIQQVTISLLRNALEAALSSINHSVSIEAKSLNGQLIVSVSDTGPGLSADAAEALFSLRGSSQIGGMGLGLSISRTIVEGHQGQIWLERSDQTGSTFRFSLPHSDPKCAA